MSERAGDRGWVGEEGGRGSRREALTLQQVPAQQLVGVHERGFGEAAVVGGARCGGLQAVESRLGGGLGACSFLGTEPQHLLLLLLLVEVLLLLLSVAEAGREHLQLLLLLEHLQLDLLLLLLCWGRVGACVVGVGGLRIRTSEREG